MEVEKVVGRVGGLDRMVLGLVVGVEIRVKFFGWVGWLQVGLMVKLGLLESLWLVEEE